MSHVNKGRNKRPRLERYRAKLARMDIASTQYADQAKRVQQYEREGSIAMGEKTRK